MTIYFAYEINLYPFKQSADFMLGNCLFVVVKLTKNTTDFDKYKYFGYGIGFTARISFSLSDLTEFGKNVTMFGDDMSSSMHVVNRKKDILILGRGLMKGLDDTLLTAEKEYATNLSEQQKKSCLNLHYNGAKSYLFVNGVEIYKFKANDSEIMQLYYDWTILQKSFKLTM